jgi:ribosome recycling factor
MYNFTDFKKELAETKEWLVKEFASISTGRAHPGLIEGLMIDSYGTHQPVKNIASVSIEDARTIRVVPWDKSMVSVIQKTIQDEGLPFSVSSDSNGIRITIPQMTEETRKKVVKLVKEKHEEARVRVRMSRQRTNGLMDEAKKQNELDEDTLKRSGVELQKFVDEINKELDELLVAKEKDVMTV